MQEIFYGRDDVLYVSIHGDPTNFYPVVAGYEEETGTGAGESPAATVPEIIREVAAARQTERGGRHDDKRSEAAMEDRKKQGYF